LEVIKIEEELTEEVGEKASFKETLTRSWLERYGGRTACKETGCAQSENQTGTHGGH